MNDIVKEFDIKSQKYRYYVTKSTNTSFINTCNELQFLGIKNNHFMLELKDLSLFGVDPYDPNISRDMAVRVLTECRLNPWYYYREVVRMPLEGGQKVHLYLHRGAAAQFWLFHNYVDNVLCLSRRNYKTTNFLAGPMCWSYNFGTRNSKFAMFTYDQAKTIENLEYMKSFLRALPKYMSFDSAPQSLIQQAKKSKMVKDPENKKVSNVLSIKNPVSNNSVKINSKATSIAAAKTMGRGSALPIMYFDEAEWINYLLDIMDASSYAYSESRVKAIELGIPACRIFTSTPALTSDCRTGRENTDWIKRLPRWDEKLYDSTNEEIEEYMLRNGDGYSKIMYIEYSYSQIGRDEKWAREMLSAARAKGSMASFLTDILLMRLDFRPNSPFNEDDIKYIFEHKRNPDGSMLLMNKYRLDLYKHLSYSVVGFFDKNNVYFIGIDPATGSGGDNTAICIVDPRTFKVAAEFRSPYMDEPDQVQIIMDIMKMIPNSLIIIEKRSSGESLIAYLRRTYLDDQLYTSLDAEDPTKADVRENIKFASGTEVASQLKKYYGVATSNRIRSQMQQIWIRHVNSYRDTINTKALVEDLSNLIITNTGRIEASKGEHDDMWMAWSMVMWVYYHGDNLLRWNFNKGAHPITGDEPETRFEQALNEHNFQNASDYFRPEISDIDYQLNNEINILNKIGMLHNDSKDLVRVEHEDSFTDFMNDVVYYDNNDDNSTIF